MKRAAALSIAPLFENIVYTNRRGIASGLRRKGGYGFIPKKLSLEDKFLMELRLEGMTAYDIGGYEGLFTMFFARAVGLNGQVITFEPNPENFRKISDNLGLNAFTNSRVIQVGLGKERAQASLVFRPHETWRGSIDEGAKTELLQENGTKTIQVEVDTLDNQIELNNLPKPDFIKIDVEGMEMDVLLGGEKTIATHKPRLFIEIHGFGGTGGNHNMKQVVAFALDHGYSIHHVESEIPVTSEDAKRMTGGHLYCF